ncbi:sensor histidine kinase [Nocardiopsis sp. CA-288880]|uniref:sensor histidine kinase n=1 Tax=Nocardiopsis sp. CA-288880 TaxID=3239995 RepID=UPI003D990A33
MRSERTEVAQGQLRMLNLNIVFASLCAIGALLISINAENPVHAVVLGVGVAAAVLASREWSGGRASRVPLLCLVAAAAVWLVGVLVLDDASASLGISVVGTVVLFQLPRPRRVAAAVALGAFVVAVVVARMVMSPGDALDVLLDYALHSTSVAVVGVTLVFLNHLVSGLIAELEESREREAELAVARERMRFASDLHDIQGHTLHVVKLKTALARRLVRTDTGRAEEELGEIHALVGDTIAQTKALAHAQRRLNLSAELENAKNLFEAAGIRVEVRREGGDRARAGEMLGQVLRETTTNILRHAQAERVWITLSGTGISIVNDGAQEGPAAGLGGLATLRERVAGEGGELTVERKDGRFLTAASFPHTGSGATR